MHHKRNLHGLYDTKCLMDALLIFNMISGASAYSKRLSHLVDDCRALPSKIPHTQVQHCYREANAGADPLARHGATKEDDFVTLNYATHNISRKY